MVQNPEEDIGYQRNFPIIYDFESLDAPDQTISYLVMEYLECPTMVEILESVWEKKD